MEYGVFVIFWHQMVKFEDIEYEYNTVISLQSPH